MPDSRFKEPEGINVTTHLTGYAAGRLFEVDGGNDETIVVCPFEYEPKYNTWRCVVVVGSTMYPQGGYNIIVNHTKLRDDKEMFPAFRKSQTNGDKPPIAHALQAEIHDMHPQVATQILDRLKKGPVSFDISSDAFDAEELATMLGEMGIPVREYPPHPDTEE